MQEATVSEMKDQRDPNHSVPARLVERKRRLLRGKLFACLLLALLFAPTAYAHIIDNDICHNTAHDLAEQEEGTETWNIIRDIRQEEGCAGRRSGSDDRDDSDDDGDDDDDLDPEPTVKPKVFTCLTLPASISVVSDSPGIQCQQVSGPAIGNASVIAAAPLNAVDVWGNQNLTADVCLTGHGRLVFLDATTTPRALSDLPHSIRGEFTCAQISGPGTVVLLPAILGEPAPAVETPVETPTQTFANPLLIADSVGDMTPLEDCEVTPRIDLFLRVTPAGNALGLVYADIPYTALGRTANWFKIERGAREGWISAYLVNQRGDCERGIPVVTGAADRDPADEPASAVETPAEAGPDPTPIADLGDDMTPLEDCVVTPRIDLFFRATPAGNILGMVFTDIPYAALGRTANWFKIERDGDAGWISARLVNQLGDCD